MGDIGFSNLITSIDNIEAAISSVSSEATLSSINTTLSTIDGKITVCDTGNVTLAPANKIRITDDDVNSADVNAGDQWTGHNPATRLGLAVNSRNMQLWPTNGNRAGVSGDGNYYGQLMNDLGDLVVSIGSITNSSGSNMIATGAGVTSSGTLRVVLPTDQSAIPVNQNGTWAIAVNSISQGRTPTFASGSKSTTGSAQIIAASAGNKIKVYAFSVLAKKDTAANVLVRFRDGATGSFIWHVPLEWGDNGMGGSNLANPMDSPLFETTVGNALYIDLDTAELIYYNVAAYYEA